MRKKGIELHFIEPREASFQKTRGGFLSLKLGGEKRYPRVHLYRSFPLSEAGRYISVRDEEDEEIGIIEDLAAFPQKTLRLLEEELERRYFTPVIEEIRSLKQEFGYTYWEVGTDSGVCRFTVKVGDNTVRVLSGTDLLIFDVDGNRFELPNYEKLESRHLKIVETLL